MNSPKSVPAVISALLIAATAAGKTPPPGGKEGAIPVLKEFEERLKEFLDRTLRISDVICGKESCGVTSKNPEHYPYAGFDGLSISSDRASTSVEIYGNPMTSPQDEGIPNNSTKKPENRQVPH